MGLGYDPDDKTFTFNDEPWDFMIKEFQYKPLQFKEELDNLFIDNSATKENAWAPTGDNPIPYEGPMPDDLDQDTHTEFMESFNTSVLSDAADVDELKHIRSSKLKRSTEKLPTHSRSTMKGETSNVLSYSQRWPKP